MCSEERAIMGLGSQAVSAWVTKHFVTTFSKTCNNKPNRELTYNLINL